MLETFARQDELAAAAAEGVCAALRAGEAARGQAILCATGGRSPGAVYDRLAQADLDWPRVTVTLSDERCVPPDEPDSNEGLVRRRLLTRRAAGARMEGLWPPPDPDRLAALVPFDALILGMGEDGHVASLIPGWGELETALTTTAPVMTVPAGLGRPPLARVTFTLHALVQARSLFLLTAGPAKRQVLEAALAGADLPVGRLLAQAQGAVRVLWSPEPADA